MYLSHFYQITILKRVIRVLIYLVVFNVIDQCVTIVFLNNNLNIKNDNNDLFENICTVNFNILYMLIIDTENRDDLLVHAGNNSLMRLQILRFRNIDLLPNIIIL